MSETSVSVMAATGVILFGVGWGLADNWPDNIDTGKCSISENAMELCQQIVLAGYDRGDIVRLSGFDAEQYAADYANWNLAWDDIAENGDVTLFDKDNMQLKVLIREVGQSNFVASMPLSVGNVPSGARFSGSIEYADTFERPANDGGVVLYQLVKVCAQRVDVNHNTVLESGPDGCLLHGEYEAPAGNLRLGLRAEWNVTPKLATALSSNSI